MRNARIARNTGTHSSRVSLPVLAFLIFLIPLDATARGGGGHADMWFWGLILFLAFLASSCAAGFVLGAWTIKRGRDLLWALGLILVPVGLTYWVSSRPFYPLLVCAAAGVGAVLGLFARFTDLRR